MPRSPPRSGCPGKPPPPEAAPEERDWSELPHDALMAVLYCLCRAEALQGGAAGHAWAEHLPRATLEDVLRMLGHAEILGSAGQVCRSWRRAVADEAAVWPRAGPLLPAASRVAADLRAGRRREAFQADRVGCAGFLLVLAKRLPSLRSLCLTSCYRISSKRFVEAIKRFPLLEKLELSFCENIFGEAIEAVGKACPHLKCFSLNRHNLYCFDDNSNDREAWAISTMHQLRSLQLFGNNLTNGGLEAILDSCSLLESLDIRQCFNVKMNAALQDKCARIKTLRFPDDLTYDNEFPVESPIMYNSKFEFYGDEEDVDYSFVEDEDDLFDNDIFRVQDEYFLEAEDEPSMEEVKEIHEDWDDIIADYYGKLYENEWKEDIHNEDAILDVTHEPFIEEAEEIMEEVEEISEDWDDMKEDYYGKLHENEWKEDKLNEDAVLDVTDEPFIEEVEEIPEDRDTYYYGKLYEYGFTEEAEKIPEDRDNMMADYYGMLYEYEFTEDAKEIPENWDDMMADYYGMLYEYEWKED